MFLLATFLFVFFGLSIGAQEAQLQKSPIIIITVDVESTYFDGVSISLPEQVQAICTGGIPCGLQGMVSQLKRRDYQATFFLNVFEHKAYGVETIRNLAAWLTKSGQDVQLHTHPHWAYDTNRKYMYQYNLQEQTEIIREGKELLKEWTGKEITAHRAGAYGADANTLKALIKNAIYYDSSLFYGHEASKINSLDLKMNVLSMFGPLYELPVTIYKKNGYPPIWGNNLKPMSVIRKYDVNWFGNQNEARQALDQAIVSNIDFIILFLHSPSFIKGRNSAGEMIADLEAIRTFEMVLDYIGQKGLMVTTFRNLYEGHIQLNQHMNKADIIPEISIQMGTAEYFLKRSGITRNNYQIVIILVAGASGILFIIIYLFWKKKHSGLSTP